nr:hypothetical protein [Bacilli bacterium]
MESTLALYTPIELDYAILAACLREPEFFVQYGDRLRGNEFDSSFVSKCYRYAKRIHTQGKTPDLVMLLEKMGLVDFPPWRFRFGHLIFSRILG